MSGWRVGEAEGVSVNWMGVCRWVLGVWVVSGTGAGRESSILDHAPGSQDPES